MTISSKTAPKSPDDFVIAGRKRVSHWRTFKASLVVGGEAAVWDKAYEEYFHARLFHRYLRPLDVLKQNGQARGEGFSIVAIQCSLIEFLESTIQGKTYVYSRNGIPRVGAHEYSKSGEMFESFLANRQPFNRGFTAKQAHDFYVNVRCGVLHEAQTRNGWTVRAKSKTGQIIDANLKIVYRDDFQAALIEFTEWYRCELSTNRALQEAGAEPMRDRHDALVWFAIAQHVGAHGVTSAPVFERLMHEVPIGEREAIECAAAHWLEQHQAYDRSSVSIPLTTLDHGAN